VRVLAFTIAAATALPGCFLAPGMVMNETAAEYRGRQASGNDQYQVELVTPELVNKLAVQSLAGRSLIPDPLGEAPAEPYRIAPYDILHVIVWDHPELTTPTGQFRSPEENGNPVGPDGTLFYPYVGVLQVAGMTVAEVRSVLTERLATAIAKPQVEVRVAGYRGKRVQITGEVIAPSPMPIIDVPLRVQDAVAYAKGFTPDADLTNVTLTRGGQVFHLDLLALYERGDLSQNWRLQDGDIVNVGDRNRNRVFVLGEVKIQQAKVMVKRRMTLAEAIGDSGGIDPLAAAAGSIYVIRGNYHSPGIYRLDATSADAFLLATRFELEPLDVVFVATREIVRWNRVLSQILPTIQAFYQGAVTVELAKRYGW
jgi:polysaccharide export outer membrane protein